MVHKITAPKDFQRKGQPKNPEEAIYGAMCWYMFTNRQTLQEGKKYTYTHTHTHIKILICRTYWLPSYKYVHYGGFQVTTMKLLNAELEIDAISFHEP